MTLAADGKRGSDVPRKKTKSLVPLTHNQIELLATCEATGKNMAEIANIVGLEQKVVVKLLKEKGLRGEDLKAYNKAHRSTSRRIHGADIEHVNQMQALLDTAYGVVAQAVSSFGSNPDLAYKAAWDVMRNAGVPIAAKESVSPGGVTTKMTFYNAPQATQALDAVFDSIRAAQGDLSPLTPVGAPSKHIRTSTAEAIVQDAEIVKEVKDET